MFALYCALILVFHVIVCQSPGKKKLNELKNLVGLKATEKIDIRVDGGIIKVKKNNEIEFFVENINFNKTHNGQLKFLTKIKDRLEFRVRRHGKLLPNNDANDACRLQNISKHCSVTKTTRSEYYVECLPTFNNTETNLWTTAWKINHEENDTYQIDGWEKENYRIYATLHFKYEYEKIYLAKNCSYSIVFNSQQGIGRESNRDYVLLVDRNDTNMEYREEWFTRDPPQPSSRKHLPPGLRVPKKRWEIPKKPALVKFMKEEE